MLLADEPINPNRNTGRSRSGNDSKGRFYSRKTKHLEEKCHKPSFNSRLRHAIFWRRLVVCGRQPEKTDGVGHIGLSLRRPMDQSSVVERAQSYRKRSRPGKRVRHCQSAMWLVSESDSSRLSNELASRLRKPCVTSRKLLNWSAVR